MANNWKAEINKYMHYFGLVMVFVYIALGVAVFIYKGFADLNPNVKLSFAIFFFAYGFFRGARWLQKNKELKNNNDDDYQQI